MNTTSRPSLGIIAAALITAVAAAGEWLWFLTHHELTLSLVALGACTACMLLAEHLVNQRRAAVDADTAALASILTGARSINELRGAVWDARKLPPVDGLDWRVMDLPDFEPAPPPGAEDTRTGAELLSGMAYLGSLNNHGPAPAPHCDQLILHSPGACRYCDDHPVWQDARTVAGIAFSDTTDNEVLEAGLTPCPSTRRRAAEVRDRWGGNVPAGHNYAGWLR